MEVPINRRMDKEGVEYMYVCRYISICRYRYISTYRYIYVDIYIYIQIYIDIHTHTYSVKYYSAMKKNEILPFETTWMDLEDIMLSEISQTEKDKYCMVWNLKNKTNEQT